MASVARPALAAADAYRVLAASGRVGTVEEIWFSPTEEALALVVRLLDDRRGLLLAADVAGVSPEDRSLTIAADARLLRLDPPHLEEGDADGLPAASWRASGEALELPARGRLVRRAARAVEPARRGERPLWRTILLMVTGLAVVVGVLIGLDFLFAYVVSGGPPY
jgi:hypothetical protein